MYPNPNRGDQLFINLRWWTGVNTVSVDIYDMTGKRVAPAPSRYRTVS
jgi:hypothetical protein